MQPFLQLRKCKEALRILLDYAKLKRIPFYYECKSIGKSVTGRIKSHLPRGTLGGSDVSEAITSEIP